MFCCLLLLLVTRAVQPFILSRDRIVIISARSSSDFDDFSTEKAEAEGKALAADFYREVESHRRQRTSDDILSNKETKEGRSIEELYRVSSSAIEEIETGSSLFSPESSLPPFRKFTGAPPGGNNGNALDREREREFRLVETFERTVLAQAALILVMLVLFISVGLSGGIDETNRFSQDEINVMGEGFYENRDSDGATQDIMDGVDVIRKSVDGNVII